MYVYSSERLRELSCPYHDTESFLHLVLLTVVCTAVYFCVAIAHACCQVLWFRFANCIDFTMFVMFMSLLWGGTQGFGLLKNKKA
jgi:hypothetical protein